MSVRTVLCFGDSNTHGTVALHSATDCRRHPKPARWTSVMAAHLGDEWDVIPEGHPGRTTVHDDPIEGEHKNAMRVLKAILESHRPLDLVIVMLGTNDLKSRFNVSAHEVAWAVNRIAVEIGRSECGPDKKAPKVMIAAPVETRECGVFENMFKGAGAKSALLPDLLREAAIHSGAGFVDLNEVAQVDPGDGIHLGVEAHAAIGTYVAKAVFSNCD